MEKSTKLKKGFLLYFLIALISIGIAYANGEHDLEGAKELIDSKVPCSELTEEGLEHIGDYYMEQMHPGEQHEIMDKMMGGEGSESLRLMHINMAKSIYCGEEDVTTVGMMDMMMGRNSGYLDNNEIVGGNKMAYGMMGGTGMYGAGLYGLVWFALAAFVFSLIFWLTYKLVVEDKKRKK